MCVKTREMYIMPPHSHRCAYVSNGCENKLLCADSYLDRNWDGYPDVICRFNQDENIPCDECVNARKCDSCGSPEHLPHDEDCDFWKRVPAFPYEYEWSATHIPNPKFWQVPIEAYEETWIVVDGYYEIDVKERENEPH